MEPRYPAEVIRDPERLHAVRETGLLDTPAEESFDRLTRLAVRLLGIPTAFVSLVDDGRDFYKSCYGFPETLAAERQLEGPTFCHYALVSDGPLLIDDARLYPGFRDVPTIKTLGVIAYAGIPLVDERGNVLGSFCAIDIKPRAWSEFDVEVLTTLAVSTLREIELRAALQHEREAVRENVLLYEAAQSATKAKDEFLAMISHELRTPMTSILGWTRMLAEGDLDPATFRLAVDSIERSTKDQARLIEDLLDVSRIAAGKLSIDRQPVDLLEVIREAFEVMKPVAQERKIELSLLLPSEPCGMHADRHRLQQIVWNLITNALKFTPAGGRVDVTLSRHGEGLSISVKDTGQGISAEFLPHIFERFRTAEQPSSSSSGLGLGLAIVKHLVEQHDGEITAASEGRGRGSEFTIRLPVAQHRDESAIGDRGELQAI